MEYRNAINSNKTPCLKSLLKVRYSYLQEVIMKGFAVTSLSSKGQVVIPNSIRKELGITEGTQFIVFSDGMNLLLKPIESPKIDTFKHLINESRKFAKKAGLKKSDVQKTKKKVRHASRS